MKISPTWSLQGPAIIRQQRRFPAARRSHEHSELALLDGQETLVDNFGRSEALADLLQFDAHHRLSLDCAHGDARNDPPLEDNVDYDDRRRREDDAGRKQRYVGRYTRPCSAEIATITVRCFCMISSEISMSFQQLSVLRMPSVTSAGIPERHHHVAPDLDNEAPSIRAASISSRGRPDRRRSSYRP